MSNSDRLWAGEFVKDRHVVALDIQGWKIAAKVGPIRWLFDSRRSGLPYPEWCDRTRQGQSNKLKGMSKDEQLEWASNVLSEITDAHVAVLDTQGWKIVNKDDPNRRWPYGVNDISYACPDWCEDLRPSADHPPQPHIADTTKTVLGAPLILDPSQFQRPNPLIREGS